jgi:hypothetical protein
VTRHAPRRTLQLERAARALELARSRVAAREPGWDPWRVVDAQARYDAALAAALGEPADETDPDAGSRDGVPRMLLGRDGR